MTRLNRSSFGFMQGGDSQACTKAFELTSTLVVLNRFFGFKQGEIVTVIERKRNTLICHNGEFALELLPSSLSLPQYPAAQRLIGAQHVICK